MSWHPEPELWLEVKDNDWYSAKLRELEHFNPYGGQTLLMADSILKECYIKPIVEQLNKPYPWWTEGVHAVMHIEPPKPKVRFWVRFWRRVLG